MNAIDINKMVESKVVKQKVDIYAGDVFIEEIEIALMDDIFEYFKKIKSKYGMINFRVKKVSE